MRARFIDPGAVFGGWVGLGTAIVLAMAFELIIPVQALVFLLAPLMGVLIGVYANVRSERWRPRGRVLANAAYAGLVTGVAMALIYVGLRLVFIYGDTGALPDGTQPPVPYRRRLHLSALREGRPGARAGDAWDHRRGDARGGRVARAHGNRGRVVRADNRRQHGRRAGARLLIVATLRPPAVTGCRRVNINTLEYPAGEDQLVVIFVNEDDASAVDPEALATELAEDAARRRTAGWRLSSIASMPTRQMGTAGNILFQSGGQYATQVALIAVYSR